MDGAKNRQDNPKGKPVPVFNGVEEEWSGGSPSKESKCCKTKSQSDGARFGARLILEMLHNIKPTYPDTEIFHTLDFCLGCDSIPEFVRKPVDSVTHREMS